MDDIKPGSIIYTNNPPVEIKGLMTLRDYFAAKAMQAMISFSNGDLEWAKWDDYAEDAYEVADKMLKARLKNEAN